MDIVRIIIITLMLLICTVTDIKTGKINVLLCSAVVLLGIALDVIAVMEGESVYTYLTALMPGIVFIVLSRLTSGAVGVGDGIVIFSLGILTDIGHIICGLTIALMLAAFVALILMIFVRRDGKSGIPFMPFLFIGMLCSIV